MAKAFGATTRSSRVGRQLGAAARTGGGGAATIGKVTSFLAGGRGPTANFVNAGGRLNAARARKSGGGGGRK